MNHTIRIRISRRRWTPEDIEAGDANDTGECWDELFEDAEEADAYLYNRFAASLEEVASACSTPCGWFTYSDDGDTRETIEEGGTIEWTATLVDLVPPGHIAPPPFNPDFDPRAKGRLEAVCEAMERDGFYDCHTREECAQEVSRRLSELK